MSETYVLEQVHVCRPDEMRQLLKAGDWWEEYWDDSVLITIVEHSFAFVIAKDNSDKWIGMGRVISDGVSDAYLQDIVVLPEWREKGIGTAIVRNLMKLCYDAGIGWIGIIAAPETEYFYRRFGFARMGGYTPMRFDGNPEIKRDQ